MFLVNSTKLSNSISGEEDIDISSAKYISKENKHRERKKNKPIVKSTQRNWRDEENEHWDNGYKRNDMVQ